MVNVPPLLSSTPPPIDFGEDDDDDSGLQTTIHLDDADDYSSSEFGLVTTSKHNNNNNNNKSQPNESELNIKVVEVPPPDLALIENTKSTVEAFNYHVYHEEMSPPTPPPPSSQQQSEEADREEEEHVPSLKLDSLSLYSSESTASGTISPSTQSPVVEPPPSPTHVPNPASVLLKHQVTLEDVTDDDTDEECSPKKPKELYIREGADDFFAIELVGTTPTTNEVKELNKESDLDKPMADNDSFADFEEATVTMPVPIQNIPLAPVINDKNDDDDDDFGDFADFSAAPPAPMPALVAPVSIPAPLESVPAQQEDGFDDFQEFASPTHHVNAHDGDDDDEFGEFSEPPPALTVAVPPPPPPAPKQLSINERVKPVLEAMFPSTACPTDQAVGHYPALAKTQTLSFGAIEQAHAMNYQWANSEMRHSLVRSLGIDSRNILFGDKWNSSMPRFAANLSFDPLKPLKTSTANSQNTTTVLLPTVATNNSPVEGLEPTTTAASTATQASQIETRSGPAHGEKSTSSTTKDDSSQLQSDDVTSSNPTDATAGTSAYAAPATAAPLSAALSTNGFANDLIGSQQLHQQSKQFTLRAATPSPPPPSLTKQEDIEIGSSTIPVANTSNNSTSYALPLKETHIYTPSKSDTAVAKTTTLAPIDFDFEIASAGIIIDETVVKKEYRDVEYKPPFGLDSPNKLNAGINFDLPPAGVDQKDMPPVVQEEGDNDDFSEFQSMPAAKSNQGAAVATGPSRNGTPTFGEQMILSPAILLPQAIPLAKTAIQWGENALSNINADEMARIEELFSSQAKPPTISATVAKKPSQSQQPEDDEWSDFVSAPVNEQQSPSNNNNNNNNNVNSLKKSPPAAVQVAKDDDWSDFVSSTPLPGPPAPVASVPPPPQFNSGAWQSANFYNNPLSLYQQQLHSHSNLVRNSNRNRNNNSNINYNANNNVPATPQQIHIMHDFSTAPSSQSAHPTIPTYQQQHQRQQFQIGNAKVAPRISLIPDLSFVAPALPTNAGAFMSALPKPSFSAKK